MDGFVASGMAGCSRDLLEEALRRISLAALAAQAG